MPVANLAARDLHRVAIGPTPGAKHTFLVLPQCKMHKQDSSMRAVYPRSPLVSRSTAPSNLLFLPPGANVLPGFGREPTGTKRHNLWHAHRPGSLCLPLRERRVAVHLAQQVSLAGLPVHLLRNSGTGGPLEPPSETPPAQSELAKGLWAGERMQQEPVEVYTTHNSSEAEGVRFLNRHNHKRGSRSLFEE